MQGNYSFEKMLRLNIEYTGIYTEYLNEMADKINHKSYGSDLFILDILFFFYIVSLIKVICFT